MATINSATTRGSAKASGNENIWLDWYEIRDFVNAGSVVVNTTETTAIRVSTVNTFPITWYCNRYFMAFDTSAITSVPGSATLYIWGYLTSSSDFIAVKATAPTTSTNIATTNYSSIDGYVAGVGMNGYVTDYSSVVNPPLSNTSYNAIPLNAAALSDMNSLSTFKIALVNYTYDYLYSAPSAEFRQGINATNQPYIEYTGFNGKVYSISLASIGNVDGVSFSSINKINT
jgi:hypothetical protein